MSKHSAYSHAAAPTAYSTAGGAITVGVDLIIRSTCTIDAYWFFTPDGAQTVTGTMWSYTGAGNSTSDGTLVASSTAVGNGASLGWSPNTWVRIPLASPVTLTPGNYRAAISTTGGGSYPYTNGYYTEVPGSLQTNAFGGRNVFSGPLALITSRQSHYGNGPTPEFPASTAGAMASFWVDVELTYANPSHTWADSTGHAYNLDGYANRAAMLADGWDFGVPVSGGVWNSETGNVTYNPVTVPQTQSMMDWICRDLPADWVSVRATIQPHEGTAAKGGYGLAVFGDDGGNVLTFGARGIDPGAYSPRMVDQMGTGTVYAAIDINIPTFTGTHLRLDRDPYTNEVMAQWSNDGTEWRYIRDFTHTLANPRLALVAYGGDGTQSVTWHSVEVVSLAQVATASLSLGTSPLSLKVGGSDVLLGYLNGVQVTTTALAGNSVAFTFLGDTFDPQVELHAGSTAVVSWGDEDGNILAVGPNPSISLGYARERVLRMFVRSTVGADAFDQVKTINLGYNLDDVGLFMPDVAYARPPMLVSGIANLNLCTALVNFMAGRTPLRGAVDFSGMSALQQINCFNARIESVDLTGCTSLVRLCVEACAVSHLDLNPVSASLKDLRAATQYESDTPAGSLTGLVFTPITATMASLYHYCTRDQPVTNTIPLAKTPVVEQRWDWNNGITTIDTPVPVSVTSYLSQSNTYNQATVDAILVSIDSHGVSTSPRGWPLAIDLTGSAHPSATGLAARTSLIAKGWTVNIS
jgi:hypothetical protein